MRGTVGVAPVSRATSVRASVAVPIFGTRLEQNYPNLDLWVFVPICAAGQTGPAGAVDAAPRIAGVWHTTIKIEAIPEGFYGLWSFYGDGTFLDINTYKEMNPGIWMGAGDTYTLTFWGFGYDEKGKVNGRGKVRLQIKMDGADQFTAAGVTDVFDLQGQPMASPFNGPFMVEGMRMQLELP
jgi:hypothetical protein